MAKGRTATRVRKKSRRASALKVGRPEAKGRLKGPAALESAERAGSPLAGAGPVENAAQAGEPAPGTHAVWRGPHPDASTCPAAVRTAAPADAAAVSALWLELNRLHLPLGDEWAVAEGAAERYAHTVTAAAANPRMTFLVAEMEVGGEWRIAGFVQASVKLRSSVYHESVVGEIPAICVAPDACGRGVGSALVAGAMEWFQKRGISRVETLAAASNISARAFWRATGFRESATILWAEVPPSVKPGEPEHVLPQGTDAPGEA